MADPPNKRRKTTTQSSTSITDPRFAHLHSDPRYRLPSKRHSHVKLDKRFARFFRDDDFVRKAKVDRYGRPLETDSERKRLQRRYGLEKSVEPEGSGEDDEVVQKELNRAEKTHDPLREGKQGLSETSSLETSSSESDSENEADVVVEEAIPQPQQDDGVPMGEVSSRLAVVNLDWDNIDATDLLAVFSSFVHDTGKLLKVSIYPSEFGKERLEREEMEGPPKEIFAPLSRPDEASQSFQTESNTDSSVEDIEHDDSIKQSLLQPDSGEADFNAPALRRYQLDRLRYCYAVLTFSSLATAKAVYDACDGTEYLSSANFFDLRFVPEDTSFQDDIPKEECSSVPDGYKPTEFVTDALQHSKVRLTWDAEGEEERKEARSRAFGMGQKKGKKMARHEIDENDLKAYLGSGSSEDDNGLDGSTSQPIIEQSSQLSKKEAERQRMRALLGLPTEPSKSSRKVTEDEHVGDLQITFSAGLSADPSNGEKQSVFQNDQPDIEETTVERYVRKERERKTKRRERAKSNRETVTLDSDENGANQTTTPDPSKEADTENLGFDDPFFAEPDSKEAQVAAKSVRKEERRKKREERGKEESVAAAEREKLRRLMGDDLDDDEEIPNLEASKRTDKPKKTRHFDMAEIEKAEKAARRRDQKQKKASRAKAGQIAPTDATTTGDTAGTDGFRIDTTDPRFSRLFSEHEFAVDPTNPRFRSTHGMKQLLKEARRRRGDGTA